MTTQQIAERLVELCTKGEFEAAQKELYAIHATSTEPFATPEFEKETKGLDAILEKGQKFESMVEEMHSMHMAAPIVAGNSFAAIMSMDVTMGGKRTKMSELCVYEVKDGKIVSEVFFM